MFCDSRGSEFEKGPYCDFVKMSLSTYFTHVTFFNQKLNRYMLIANTNTAIKLFTRSYIHLCDLLFEYDATS